MEYREVEYSVVQLPEGNRWRWEVRFGDGKTKTGVTPVSRAVAIKQAKSAIDPELKIPHGHDVFKTSGRGRRGWQSTGHMQSDKTSIL